MKKILACLLLLCGCVHAQPIITETVVVTNTPTYGASITHNGNTRIWTNNVTAPASQILIPANPILTASNIFQAYSLNPDANVKMGISGTNVYFYGSVGAANTVTIVSNYATISASTYTLNTNSVGFRAAASLVGANERTNTANGIVSYLNDSSVTNPVSASSQAMVNFVSNGQNEIVTGANIYSNALQFITGGGLSNVALTNITYVSGSNGDLALMTIERSAISGFFLLTGTNGLIVNIKMISPVMTNAQNYGQPFRSPGGGTGSEQFGIAAVAATNNALAVGDGAEALGISSISIGGSSQASSNLANAFGIAAQAGGWGATAWGPFTWAFGSNALAVGYLAVAGDLGASQTNNYPTALGAGANSQFDFSTAVGPLATTTAPHQVMLGTASEYVQVPNYLAVAGAATFANGITNLYNRGSNTLDGSLNYVRKDITGLANGGNASLNISTNVYVNVSGPTGAFSIDGIAGGGNGRIIIIQNATGQTMTIKNASGFDSTASNRILTGTGADVSVTSNPGAAQLIYDSSASRWTLLNHN